MALKIYSKIGSFLKSLNLIVTLSSGVDSRWRNFPTIKKTMVVHHVSNHTDQTCPKRNDRESLDFILWKTSFSPGLGRKWLWPRISGYRCDKWDTSKNRHKLYVQKSRMLNHHNFNHICGLYNQVWDWTFPWLWLFESGVDIRGGSIHLNKYKMISHSSHNHGKSRREKEREFIWRFWTNSIFWLRLFESGVDIQ